MAKCDWLNTKYAFYPKLEKPCIKLKYCPYGELVEEFPFHDNHLSCSEKNGAIITFGHDCPAHYHAEFVEGKKIVVPKKLKEKK